MYVLIPQNELIHYTLQAYTKKFNNNVDLIGRSRMLIIRGWRHSVGVKKMGNCWSVSVRKDKFADLLNCKVTLLNSCIHFKISNNNLKCHTTKNK